MDNKSDKQLLIIQATIQPNRQETDEKNIKDDEKLTKIREYLKVLTSTITSMMDQTTNSKLSPSQKDI